jgi:hypothetical protein
MLQEPAPVTGSTVQERTVSDASAVERFIAAIRDKECTDLQLQFDLLAPKDFQIREPYVRGASSEYIVWVEDHDCECSPTGNCPVWVLAPEGQTFAILLDHEVSQGSPEVLDSFSHGRPGLVLSLHDSATRSVDETSVRRSEVPSDKVRV